MKESQSGSVHAIIIGVLAIALVGAVGLLFWQNVLSKNDENPITENAKVSAIKEKTTEKYCASAEKLCFDYPKNWTVDTKETDPKNDGVAETIVVSDDSGKKWLKLTTGMGGVGGMCAPTDGSYVKVLKTYSTEVEGKYLVRDGADAFTVPTVYAVDAISYDNGRKVWTNKMELNTSKATTSVGKMGACDLGIAVFPGKNVDIEWDDGSHGSGSISFTLYADEQQTNEYKSELEANTAQSAPNAQKAYEILRSVRYE